MLTKSILSDKVLEDLNIAALVPEVINTINIAGFRSKPEVCPATKAKINVINSDRVHTSNRAKNRSEAVTDNNELTT